jgi:hypothetical protein
MFADIPSLADGLRKNEPPLVFFGSGERENWNAKFIPLSVSQYVVCMYACVYVSVWQQGNEELRIQMLNSFVLGCIDLYILK